ncbi:MAG TPA: hypothetical protein VIT65_02430 [Microlunatus sp.]
MAIAALITWVITAGVGSYMVATWRRHGGLRGGRTTHLPPARVFTHLGLAVFGLVLWIIFVATGGVVWSWIAASALVVVAVLGGVLVRRWVVDGRLAMSGSPSASPEELAEQHIARPVVIVHGVFATITFILVVLAAGGVGS